MSDAALSGAMPDQGGSRGSKLVWHVVNWSARIIVAGLFLLAAGIKIAKPGEFAKDIASYTIFPREIINVTAFVVPWIELLTALALLVGLWRREARMILIAMLVAFTILKSWVMLDGLDVDCGCFGDSLIGQLSKGWNGVWLNLVLIALVIVEWIGASRVKRAPEPATPPSAS